VLSLLLQAGQVMHELLCGRSHFRRQPRGGLIVHRGGRGEQLVGATQQRASLSEERGRLAGAAVIVVVCVPLPPDIQAKDYLDGSRNGDCNHSTKAIRVEVRNEPAQQVKTLAHELSHAILHGDDFTGSREIAELEVESVAYIVCQNFGLDSGAYSFGYVASWIGGGPEAIKAITASGQRIVRAVRQILDSESASEEVAA
jgi:hypothetical protein